MLGDGRGFIDAIKRRRRSGYQWNRGDASSPGRRPDEGDVSPLRMSRPTMPQVCTLAPLTGVHHFAPRSACTERTDTVVVMRLRFPTRSLRWQFDHNDGPMMHKWLHYFEIYERHFEPYRGRKINVLEIGVSHGGSLQMWRKYFGRRATIIGVDIEPRVVELAEPGIELHVGDQSDPAFLQRLVDQYGKFDVVIDDGSHLPAHQIATITHLWPHLAEGGVYLVEDLHTNYWGGYYESYRGNPDSFISWAHSRIDDMHAFHSQEPDFVVNEWTVTLGGLHAYDSIVVLDKTEAAATGAPEVGSADVRRHLRDRRRRVDR